VCVDSFFTYIKGSGYGRPPAAAVRAPPTAAASDQTGPASEVSLTASFSNRRRPWISAACEQAWGASVGCSWVVDALVHWNWMWVGESHEIVTHWDSLTEPAR